MNEYKMSKEIISDVTFGTYMPFFALRIDTTHPCTSDNVNNKEYGCLISQTPGVLEKTGLPKPEHQWLKFKEVVTKYVDDKNEIHPAAFVDVVSPQHNYKWLTEKDNNGSQICKELKSIHVVPCTQIDCRQTISGTCNAFVTGINAEPTDKPWIDSGKPVKKPWFANPSMTSKSLDTTEDPRETCPEYPGYVRKQGPPTYSCMPDPRSSHLCKSTGYYCGGFITGSVQLHGIVSTQDQSDVALDTENLAGILYPTRNESTGPENTAGGKFVKKINAACFDPNSHIDYLNQQRVYNVPKAVVMLDIDNNPAALDTGKDYKPVTDNNYNLAISETTKALFQPNKPNDWVSGVGNILYMPPLYQSSFRSWIDAFTGPSISIQTYSAGIKLPDYVGFFMTILAYTSIVPRAMMYQAFNMFSLWDDLTAATRNFQKLQFSILSEELDDAIGKYETYGDSIVTQFQEQKMMPIYKSLKEPISDLFYGKTYNKFIIPFHISSTNFSMALSITVPMDIAIGWGVLRGQFNDAGSTALNTFFGEKIDKTSYAYESATYTLLKCTWNQNTQSTVNISKSSSLPKDTTIYNTKPYKVTDDTAELIFNLAATIIVSIQKPSLIVLGYLMKWGGDVAKDAVCNASTDVMSTFPSLPTSCVRQVIQHNRNFFRDKLPFYCSHGSDTGKFPRSYGIDSVMVTMNNPICECFNSKIGPPNFSDPGNTTSLCFSAACSAGIGPYNLRDIEGIPESTCMEKCPVIKGWFGQSINSEDPAELDVGRVENLCKFTPYITKGLYNTKTLLPSAAVSVFVCVLGYLIVVAIPKLKKNQNVFIPILAVIFIVLVGGSGFLLAAGITECQKASPDPKLRKQNCKSRIGLTLPQEYCGPALDHCECGFPDIVQCPSGCCCKGRACTRDCTPGVVPTSNPASFYRMRTKSVMIAYIVLFVITIGLLLLINLKYEKRNIAVIIISILVVGLLSTGTTFAAIGKKVPSSIFGC